MNDSQIQLIMTFLTILLIVGIIYLIWALIWRALYHPIKLKDELLKEREDARKELLEIQAAKAVEWDKYKDLEDENNKLRKSYFQAKADLDSLKENVAKLQVDKDNLISYNRQMKSAKENTKKS